MTAERFGKYERLREIGSGGFGTVYEGRDTQLDRPVALKFLDSNDPDDVERFRREARLAAQLSHPSIVAVHDVLEAGGRHLLVMDLLDGVPAGRAGLSPRGAAELIRETAAALAHAHARGVIHRDLKPDNILVCDGRPVLTDFGLARGMQEASTLSMTGAVQGTPSFMSPEQARGDRRGIGPATDVYGLGATLYALVAGRPPFTGRNPFELIRRVIDEEPPPLACDEALRTIVAACMEKEPRRRYPTAAVVADELGRYLRGEPILARPAGAGERVRRWIARHRAVSALTAATVAVALAAGVAGVMGLRAKERERVALADAMQHRMEAAARGMKLERALSALTEAERGWVDPQLDIAAWRAGLEEQLALLDGDDAQTQFYRGWALRLLGRRAEAVAALDRAVELDGGHAAARYERLRLRLDEYLRLIWTSHAATDRENVSRRRLAMERAREDLEAVRGRLPGPDADALVDAYDCLVNDRMDNLARICLDRIRKGGRYEHFRLLLGIGCVGSKEYRGAIEQLNEAIFLHPNLREGLFARAFALSELDRVDEATLDLDRSVALDPEDPLVYYQRGRCHRRAGRLDSAVADFTEALRLDPRMSLAYGGRSAALIDLGDREGALEDARRALEANPDDEAAAVNLAAALIEFRRFDEAEAALDRALEDGVAGAPVYINRAAARFALGRLDDALADLAEAARVEPRNPHPHFQRGVYFKSLGRLDEARASLDRAVELNPDHFDALVNRAMIHASQGRGAEAKADAERSVGLTPPTPSSLNNRALARERVGDLEGAEADLGEYIRLRPNHKEAYYNRAQLRIRRGDFVSAEADLDAALSIDPEFRSALQDRSGVRLQLHRWADARDDATTAIRLKPDDPAPYVNRGLARSNLGDLQGGAEDLRAALDRAPADWPARASTEGTLREVERLLREREF